VRFDDTVVAGTTLIRAAIQSADYVPGVSGWIIRKDGSAEFNDGNFRGDVVVTATDGTQITIRASNGAIMTLRPPTSRFNELLDQIGIISSDVQLSGGSPRTAYLYLQSPIINDAARAPSSITLWSEPNNGVPFSGMQYVRPLAEIGTAGVNVVDQHVSGASVIDDTLTVYGRDQGRGLWAKAESTVLSGAVGTTETVMLSSTDLYKAGRAYEVRHNGGVRGAAANCYAQFRLRNTNAAGQDLGEFYREFCGSSASTVVSARRSGAIFTIGSSDITRTVALTMQGTATGDVTHFASTNTPRQMLVFDIGRATDYPTNVVLV
jgi:hypothetical protein